MASPPGSLKRRRPVPKVVAQPQPVVSAPQIVSAPRPPPQFIGANNFGRLGQAPFAGSGMVTAAAPRPSYSLGGGAATSSPALPGHLLSFGNAASAAPAPPNLYMKMLLEAKRASGPQAPAHPGPMATKEQIMQYHAACEEYRDQLELDRQSEAIQLSTEADTEAHRQRKQQEQQSLLFEGHLARSGTFSRSVLFTQTPFAALTKWLDVRTDEVEQSGALEFTVCLSREVASLPWGIPDQHCLRPNECSLHRCRLHKGHLRRPCEASALSNFQCTLHCCLQPCVPYPQPL